MKMKNRIDYIREKLPKHMVPSFNKIVAENKDAKDFNIFLQAYSETIDEVELAPIQAWEAFEEKNKKDAESFDKWCKENDVKPSTFEEDLVEPAPEGEVIIEDSEGFTVKDELGPEEEAE